MYAKAIAIALGGGQRRVEADTDHVDYLGLLEDRHAGQADIGQKAAHMGVDLIFDSKLLGLAPAYVGLGFVIDHEKLERPAVDAAGLFEGVDGHLQPDQRSLAASSGRPRKRLKRADLIGLFGPESGAPWRWHQHGGSKRTGARRPPTH